MLAILKAARAEILMFAKPQTRLKFDLLSLLFDCFLVFYQVFECDDAKCDNDDKWI